MVVVVVLVEEEKAIAPLSHCLFLWSDALQVLPRRVSRLSRGFPRRVSEQSFTFYRQNPGNPQYFSPCLDRNP